MKYVLLLSFVLFSSKQMSILRPIRISGSYGKFYEFSIAFDKDSVTGAYQYYDKWNNKRKEFTDINVFCFQGRFVSDSIAIITAGWPDQKLTGKIKLYKDSSLNIWLSGQPDGYNDINFASKDGVTVKINKAMPWKKIIMLNKKTKLFNAPDSTTVKKGYLIGGDIIKITNADKLYWSKIDYSSTADIGNNKSFWIQRQ